MQKIVWPKISVVVPTYNSALYLPMTIDSILDQEYPNYEVIIIDDGSVDNTDEVLSRYGKNIIKIRHENSGGPAKPRNVGISHTSGELISLFDSDDIMLPGKLSRAAEIFVKHPEISLTFSDFRIVDDKGILLKERFLDNYRGFRRWMIPGRIPKCHLLTGIKLCEALIDGNFIGTSSVVVHRDALLDCGGFDESLLNADDIDMWHRLARKEAKFGFIDLPLHSYRRRSGSITRRGAGRYPSMLKMLDKQRQYIKEKKLLNKLDKKINRVAQSYGLTLIEEGRLQVAREVILNEWCRYPSAQGLRNMCNVNIRLLLERMKNIGVS